MDAFRHVMFLPPGTPFFDRDDSDVAADEGFAALPAEAPEGWVRNTGPDWTMLTPPEARMPQQGWKIHVSATPDNAESVLVRSYDWLVARRMPFKFIRSKKVLLRRNGKYGDRGASGKFITVYPADEAALAAVLEGLGGVLDGEPGPYILSDLRWRSGPLYVRYGGFVARTMKTERGESVPCIEAPDGRLVPDRRGPSFKPPEWVTIPDCLAEAVEARNAGTLRDFPYRAEQALHFSNGGGVYRGTDLRDGKPVLLREARPLSGLDTNGEDAVARLVREHECLLKLAGLPWIPALVEARVGHEHHFLIREYVAGETLAVRTTKDNPPSPGDDPRRTAEYTEWALGVLDQIEQGLAAMHERGVAFGDLHPGNVMVREDGSVVFIDLETASTDPAARQVHAAPGFAAPATHRGKDVDRYALGCLRIALFAPLTSLLPWDQGKVDRIIEHIESRYPVPADYAAKVRADLAPVAAPVEPAGPVDGARNELSAEEAAALGEPPRPATEPAPRPVSGWRDPAAVADGILVTATPKREDRLFPGDATQFLLPEGGVCLAYGAAGVLWALAEAGTEVSAAHTDWLEAAAGRLTDPAPGLYTGVAGIASTLHRLGRSEAAAALFKEAAKAEPGNDSLFDGRAGLGLAQLHFARTTGDDVALKHATALAEQIVERTAAQPPRRGEAGLLRGRAGGALLLLRLYEQSPDTGLLDAARLLLDTDLRALGWAAAPAAATLTGGVAPDEGWAEGAYGARPLLASGGGGTAMVLADYLAHRAEPRFALAHDTVLRTARDSVPHTAGLFHGWAGVMVVLSRLGRTGGAVGDTPAVDPAAALDLYGVGYQGRPAFLGVENVRLSTDLATGAAGVLLALRATSGAPFALPFL